MLSAYSLEGYKVIKLINCAICYYVYLRSDAIYAIVVSSTVI